MPPIDFNEKEFESAFNSEMIRTFRNSLNGFPEMPTAYAESRLGYDAKYELFAGKEIASIYLQFKKPNVHSRCIRCGDSHLSPSDYDMSFNIQKARYPYLWHQHNILKQYADLGYPTYYISPLFSERAYLYECIRNNTLIDKSGFFSLAQMPLLPTMDRSHHRVCYSNRSNRAVFCTDPISFEYSGLKLFLMEIRNRNQFVSFTEDYVRGAFEGAFDVIKKETGKEPPTSPSEEQKDIPVSARLAYLLKKQYNLEWFLITRDEADAFLET